jgi:hypothetical protein
MDLWNRTDCCSDELSRVYIFTSADASTNPTSWTYLTFQNGQAGTPSVLDLFGVTARHVKLEREAADRALMMAEVQIYGTPQDTVDPSAPNGLTATAVSGPRVDLTWFNSNDNVGVKRYILERCAGSTCTGFLSINSNVANTAYAYSDTSVAAGKTYRYRIKSQDFAGHLSPVSNYAVVTTF